MLFDISLGHAGEHLDNILGQRPLELPAPTIMNDALSSNTVTKRAREKEMDAQARLAYHQEHSLPVMQDLCKSK